MDKNTAQLKQEVTNSVEKSINSLLPEPASTEFLDQIPLPPSREIAAYSRTSKGSLHIQSVLNGCRVVQSLLEFSSPDQQRAITSLLCTSNTLLTLAADRHGTYVAQACLPHLTPSPTALLDLVNAVLGHTTMLGQHQCGTFFLQRLVGILSTHYPGSSASCLLQEDILGSLAQLVITEPGSRCVC